MYRKDLQMRLTMQGSLDTWQVASLGGRSWQDAEDSGFQHLQTVMCSAIDRQNRS